MSEAIAGIVCLVLGMVVGCYINDLIDRAVENFFNSETGIDF